MLFETLDFCVGMCCARNDLYEARGKRAKTTIAADTSCDRDTRVWTKRWKKCSTKDEESDFVLVVGVQVMKTRMLRYLIMTDALSSDDSGRQRIMNILGSTSVRRWWDPLVVGIWQNYAIWHTFHSHHTSSFSLFFLRCCLRFSFQIWRCIRNHQLSSCALFLFLCGNKSSRSNLWMRSISGFIVCWKINFRQYKLQRFFR